MLNSDIIFSSKEMGFGTWKLGNNSETTRIICNAIDAGYKLIDTASAYLNEEAIGQAIFEKRKTRNDLFVSSKLWNSDRNNVIEACKKTISNLKCDYLDLYLIHWPASKAVHSNWEEINANVWKQMEKILELGLVKNIGVSNFNQRQLETLLKTAIVKPLVNQIECHIGFVQKDTIKYCQDNNILVQAWSPLGSGKILKKEEIIKVAEKYNKSTAQICLRWCIQNKIMPIVKSTDVERMKSNLDIFDFKIVKEDMEYLNNLPFLGSSGLDSETIKLFE